MRQRITVERGQRYIQNFQKSAHKELWEVASLSPDTMRIQHARLVKVTNRSDSKTLSCAVLNGKHGFSLANS